MSMDTTLYKLGDISSMRYGKLPPSSIDDGAYPIWSGYRNVGRANVYNCEKGTLIVVARGVGGTGDVKIAPENCFLTNLSIAVNLDKKICNPHYLYYNYLLSNLRYLDSGSAQSQITIDDLKKLDIELPSLEEQERVVGYLETFDAKIENNSRINTNLEAQAQALFKSWFIDFEPFGGTLPDDWKEGKLGEICVPLKEKVGDRDDVKVLSPVTTGHLMLSEEFFSKQVYSASIAKYIIVPPMAFAYNPARVNIGSLGMNEFDFDGCVSPVYSVFECKDGYEYFFDLFRRTETFKEEVRSRAIGGVRQTLNYKDFELIDTVVPSKKDVERFNELYGSLLEVIKANQRESQRLATLRDTLLPKLMKGEIEL